MSAADVVESVDVVEEHLSDMITGRPSMPPDQFGFEGFEESLDGGVVLAIGLRWGYGARLRCQCIQLAYHSIA